MSQPIAKPSRFYFPILLGCAALLAGLLALPASRSALAEPISGEQSRPSGAPSAGKDDTAATLSVQVNVVNVFASVRDKKGNLVPDLTKEDFTLSEDGRPQNIGYFTKETNLPLTLGLLVDTSLSQRRVLDQERSASRAFLDQMVRENTDKAFIIHFDREV